MKTLIRLIVVLVVTAAVSAAALARVYAYAQPKIEQHKRDALEAAIFEVLPGTKSYEEVVLNGKLAYAGYESEEPEAGRRTGYAVATEGSGFQGVIGLMFGITPEGTELTGLTILESVETPGLGDNIKKEPFRGQFAGLSSLGELSYAKNRPPSQPLERGQIDAITGATISSAAVVRIVNMALETIRPALGKGGE